MAKFKVGDRVKCVTTKWEYCSYKPDKTYTVKSCDESMVKTDFDGNGNGENGWFIDNFELVTPAPSSPIRTVTKREIVAGTYNQFQIFNGNPGVVNVKTDGKYICLKSAELRAAATLFNELADVLDENTPAELRVG